MSEPSIDVERYLGEPRPRSWRVAFALTLACPGLGAVYLGRLLPGVGICAGYVCAWAGFVLLWSHLKFFPALPLLVLVVGLSLISVMLALDAAAKARREGAGYILKGINHPVVYVGLALAVFYLPMLGLLQFTGERMMALVWVDTDAMFPTLLDGDLLLVDRTAFLEAAPSAGDVVVIRQPGQGEALRLGRIIGVPGDEVEVNDSVPIINGTPLLRSLVEPSDRDNAQAALAAAAAATGPPGTVTFAEQVERAQYLTAEQPTEIGAEFEPVRLRRDEFYVLHDNRAHLGDSRDVGPVLLSQIVGRPLYVAYSRSVEGIRWDRVAKRVQPQPL